MKSNRLLIVGVAAIMPLATASLAAYAEICPSRNGVPEDRDGYRITYHCDKRLPAQSVLGPATVLDAEACAEHCQSNNQCAGSQWLYASRECRLFSAGEDSLTFRRASIAIIIDREDAPVDEPGSNDDALTECQNAFDHCEHNENRLDQELQECLASQGSSGEDSELREQLETCENSRNTLQQQLTACEAGNANLLTAPVVCPSHNKKGGKNGQILRQGTGTFKFNCEAKRTGEILQTTGHGFEMCLQACAKNPQCGGTNYWPLKPQQNQRCEMFKGRPGWTGTTEEVIGALLTKRH